MNHGDKALSRRSFFLRVEFRETILRKSLIIYSPSKLGKY